MYTIQGVLCGHSLCKKADIKMPTESPRTVLATVMYLKMLIRTFFIFIDFLQTKWNRMYDHVKYIYTCTSLLFSPISKLTPSADKITAVIWKIIYELCLIEFYCRKNKFAFELLSNILSQIGRRSNLLKQQQMWNHDLYKRKEDKN